MSRRRASAANATPQPAPDTLGLLLSPGLIATAVVYCVYFYQTPQRQLVWLQALMPDQMVTASWAGDLRFFGLFDRAPILFAVAIFLAAAAALGRGALRLLGLSVEFDAWERNVFGIVLGLATVSLGTLLAGRAGLLHAWWLIAGTVGVCAAIGGGLWVRDLVAWRNAPAAGNRRVELLALGLGGVFTLLLLSAALLPPWDFDVLEYHLQAPKEWLQAGRIEFLPHNVYASMPLAAEMLALAAMATWPGADGWLWGGLVGKTLMACYVPLTALALFSVGRRWFSPLVAAVAAVIYVTLPWMQHCGANGLNEPAVAAYGFFALAAILRAGEKRVTWIALGGLFAGAAAACKYPALAMLVPPLFVAGLLAHVIIGNRPWRVSFAARDGAIFMLAAAVFVGPWLLKNYRDTGNPTYPLLVSTFGGETRTPEKDAQFRRAHAVPRDPEPLKSAFALWFLSSEGQSPILPLAFCTGIAALVVRRRSEAARVGWFAAGLCVWIAAVWFFATHRIDRFLLPAAPFACLVAGAACLKTYDRLERSAALFFFGSGLLFCLLYAVAASGDARRLTRLELLKDGAPLDEQDLFPRVSAAFRYVNENASPDAAVLCVGDAAVFDLIPRAYYHTCFDDSLLVNWTENRSAEERRAEFMQRNIAFVIVNASELARYRSPGNYGYDPRFRDELLAELVTQGVLEPVWTQPGVRRPTIVYQVLPAP